MPSAHDASRALGTGQIPVNDRRLKESVTMGGTLRRVCFVDLEAASAKGIVSRT